MELLRAASPNKTIGRLHLRSRLLSPACRPARCRSVPLSQSPRVDEPKMPTGKRRYTQSMTTTIKVSGELRDRLKAQAARDGLTLGAHLARLAEADERRHRLLALQTAIAETSTAGMETYTAESAAWERTELTDVTV